MEILNGVYFNNEDYKTLMKLASRDAETIGRLSSEVEELKAVLENVRKDRNAWREAAEEAQIALNKTNVDLKETKEKLEASIKLGTLFMIAAARE